MPDLVSHDPLSVLLSATGSSVLVAVLILLLQERLVPGKTYRRALRTIETLRDDRDDWRELAKTLASSSDTTLRVLEPSLVPGVRSTRRRRAADHAGGEDDEEAVE